MNIARSIISIASGVALLLSASISWAADGMIKIESAHDVNATMDKLESVLESKGMKVFARINHSSGAESVGMEIRPTQVMLFGNPKVGTPLMLCSQSTAIDLPQKMLVWEADDGKVYLGYNDPGYLKARHAIEGCDEVLAKVSGALGKFAAAAASK